MYWDSVRICSLEFYFPWEGVHSRCLNWPSEHLFNRTFGPWYYILGLPPCAILKLFRKTHPCIYLRSCFHWKLISRLQECFPGLRALHFSEGAKPARFPRAVSSECSWMAVEAWCDAWHHFLPKRVSPEGCIWIGTEVSLLTCISKAKRKMLALFFWYLTSILHF